MKPLKFIVLFVHFLYIFLASSAQEIKLFGKIVDSYSKEPIPNASINFNMKGTVARSDGFFKLPINESNHTDLNAKISSIGYLDTIVTLKKNSFNYIELKRSNTTLSDVVVTTSITEIIKKINNNICNNYPDKPTNCLIYRIPSTNPVIAVWLVRHSFAVGVGVACL